MPYSPCVVFELYNLNYTPLIKKRIKSVFTYKKNKNYIEIFTIQISL